MFAFLASIWKAIMRTVYRVGSTARIVVTRTGGTPTPSPSPSPTPTPTPTPTSSIAAATLTKTSSAGAQLAFTVTFDRSYAGKYFHLQLAGASNFTTPLSGEGAIREVRQLIIPEDAVSGPVFTILAGQPAGAIYARLYIEDDSPAVSDPSNVITTTVT